MGFLEVLKSMMASRTSWTLPQSAAVLVGLMTTPVTRLSLFALRRASTTERTVGGGSRKEPTSPPGSTSPRSPPTRSISTELASTEAGRPTTKAVTISPAAEMTTAITMKITTSQTPRLLATLDLQTPCLARSYGRSGGFPE